MNKKNKSVTLIELIISVTVVSIMILSFYTIDTFSRNQVLNSDRRAKVQNELAYALEHMSKYVQQARGDLSRPAIEYYPSSNPTGFRVWIDFARTPSDLTDDTWIRYRLLSTNVIQASCSGDCPSGFPENLTSRVRDNFVTGLLPSPLPSNPAGFYALISDQGSSIDIGLVGRYSPSEAVSLRNPQVGMKTKIICNSCSTN